MESKAILVLDIALEHGIVTLPWDSSHIFRSNITQHRPLTGAFRTGDLPEVTPSRAKRDVSQLSCVRLALPAVHTGHRYMQPDALQTLQCVDVYNNWSWAQRQVVTLITFLIPM